MKLVTHLRLAVQVLLSWLLGFGAWIGLPLVSQAGITAFADLSADAVSAYIAVETLKVAEQTVRLYQFADKAILPQHNSKTFQYSRYEKLNVPLTTLTEGITPADTALSLSTVTATVEQWGGVVTLTDIGQLTIKHNLLEKAISLNGLAAAYVVEREIQNVLLTGTGVRFAGGAANRGALTTSSTAATSDFATITSTLRKNGAPAFDDDLYVCIIRPDMEMDIAAGDSTWKTAASYSDYKAMYRGEITRWYSTRWIRSNTLPVYTLASSPTTAGAATGGSLAASTTYYFSIARKSLTSGIYDQISAEFSQATGAGDDSVQITLASSSGNAFDIYAGTVSGTRYLQSSNNTQGTIITVGSIPTSGTAAPAAPASGVTVSVAWVFGKEAFTCINLEGQQPSPGISGGAYQTVQAYLTPNVASDSDPLKQRRKVGWKLTFKTVINNNAFFRRFEAHTAY